jgi:hypothetical protein
VLGGLSCREVLLECFGVCCCGIHVRYPLRYGEASIP